nr:SPOR domain-containing protein [Erythrobacter sp. LQ02-29]
MPIARTASLIVAASLLAISGTAHADVKAGVDAWEAGDYPRAVAEWREPAERGDADAQFNLAQAYRLGRGVEKNLQQAESYYAKAAVQGHLKAADNLGLVLFQDGRREQAMPYIVTAADRGDPRAQYLLGIEHFNGDLVEQDWTRAYALLTLANAAGLPQARRAISQMDGYIPLEQRQQAQLLAPRLKAEADAQRSAAFASADLDGEEDVGATFADAAEARVPVAPTQSAPVAPTPLVLPPVGPAPAPPTPVAAAQAAIADAARVTGTQSPAEAARPAPGRSPEREPVAPAGPAAASEGPWKVQLGAFSVGGNADKLWRRLAGRTELAGRTKLTEREGRLTKLLAAGYPSRQAADRACAALKRAGEACLVTR